MVSSSISPKARKGISSRIAGRGLFATEQISACELVAVKGGHILTTKRLRELPDPLPNSEIQIADGLHLVTVSPEGIVKLFETFCGTADVSVTAGAIYCLTVFVTPLRRL